MFSKETYSGRRKALREMMGSGIVLLFGNNESPCNYPANGYSPFRQDSSFRYYFGIERDGLVGVIDLDSGEETLVGDDISIDDIVWCGAVPNMKDLAASCGVELTAPAAELERICKGAKEAGRGIHFLPPYRHDTMLQITDLLGIHHTEQRQAASLELIKAVVKQRSVKEPQEIEALERAAAIGYKMHTTAMGNAKPGLTERFVAGIVDGVALSYGSKVSFPTIFTQHGEIMHGTPSSAKLEEGRLVLCDCGAETTDGYCSDNTRTMPVGGRFTKRQLDIYSIVEACHDLALDISRPGITYMDVHLSVCRLMAERLKDLGLMKGNTEAAVEAGAHALFMPHGLGHMMGMDVHDMEGLGQTYVGYDDTTRPRLDQFGTASLRMGRALEEGFVVTDEPGIYFIPALIDDWKARRHCADFICYDKVEGYKDFGGIRIEDDILVTKNGCRFIGSERIPYHPADVEAFMAK